MSREEIKAFLKAKIREQYRFIIMQGLKEPHKQYIKALEAYPPIWLN